MRYTGRSRAIPMGQFSARKTLPAGGQEGPPRLASLAITRNASVEPFHAPTVEIKGPTGLGLAWIRQEKDSYLIELRAHGTAIGRLEAAVRSLLPV